MKIVKLIVVIILFLVLVNLTSSVLSFVSPTLALCLAIVFFLYIIKKLA